MKGRDIFLPKSTCDVIKIVAALLVVTAHVASTALGTYESTHWSFYVVASQNGYIGVAVFFFLSGYGLMESESKSHLGLSQFFRRRILKVYLPVLLVSAIWLCLNALSYPPHWVPTDNTLLYDFFWGFADPVMWFIRVLLLLYALFHMFSIIIAKGHRRVGMYGLLGVCLVYSMITMRVNDSVQNHSVPLFALGVLASLIKSDKNAMLKFSALTVVVGLMVSAAAFHTSHPLTGFMHSIFDYIIVLLLVGWVSIGKLRWKANTLLAAMTFDIYLVHFKLFIVGGQFLPLSAFLILSIPCSIGGAYLFLKLRTLVLSPLTIKTSSH